MTVNGHVFYIPKKSQRDAIGKYWEQPFAPFLNKDKVLLHEEKERVKTFQLWPPCVKVNIAEMAKTGFHFTGEEDTVKCFECEIEINKWNDSVAPSVIHKGKSPACPMVTGKSANNVPLCPPEGAEKVGGKKKRKTKKKVKDDEKKEEGASGSDDVATTMTTQYYFSTDMTREENRLATFNATWPHEAILPGSLMTKAGFWFRGPKDRVECAFCRGRLVNFVEGDNPVGEHARHFPTCSFVKKLSEEPRKAVLATRSARAVLLMEYSEDQVVTAVNTCKMKGDAEPRADTIVMTILEMEDEKLRAQREKEREKEEDLHKDDSDSDGDEIAELKKNNDAMKLSKMCKKCMTAEVSIVFLPCRHLVCCATCGTQSEHCPVCKNVIVGTVKTFMS